MNTTLLKLGSVSLILFLLTTNSFGTDEKKKNITKIEKEDGERTVDDANQDKAKEDTTKDGDKIKDERKNKEIKLSSIKTNIIIKRKGLHYPPYRCFIYHNNGTETNIGTSHESYFEFSIKKSLLKVGDEILVTNKLDSTGKKIKKQIVNNIGIIK